MSLKDQEQSEELSGPPAPLRQAQSGGVTTAPGMAIRVYRCYECYARSGLGLGLMTSMSSR